MVFTVRWARHGLIVVVFELLQFKKHGHDVFVFQLGILHELSALWSPSPDLLE